MNKIFLLLIYIAIFMNIFILSEINNLKRSIIKEIIQQSIESEEIRDLDFRCMEDRFNKIEKYLLMK